MTTVWGIHMGAHIGSDPIDEGFVGLGWPLVGPLDSIEDTRDAFKKAVASAYPEMKAGAVPVGAGTLFRFKTEIKEGDYVVYPSKTDRMVNIGRFTGEQFYSPAPEGEDLENYPHRRKVEWLKHLPRNDFSQSALYEIGAFISMFQIKRNDAEFLEKVDLATPHEVDDDKPDDDSVTSNVTKQAEETTHDFVIRQIYKGMNGYEFEHFTAHMLECMGYAARVSAKSGDGGVDVIAHKDELGFEPPIIKVQCKKLTGQTGEPEVNQLLGTLGEGEFALFVNLGSYSRPARLLERNRSKLRLIDGEQLVELVLEHYGKMSARYRTLISLRQIYVPDIFES